MLRLMAKIQKLGIAALVALFWFFSSSLTAQDVKIYVSPHNLNLTITKINNSIDKNGWKKLELNEYHTSPRSKRKFQGVVFIISFEHDAVKELVACEPTTMLDMPLKISIWEEDGDVFISYLDARTLRRRFALQDCDDIIDEINRALIRIVNDAIRKR